MHILYLGVLYLTTPEISSWEKVRHRLNVNYMLYHIFQSVKVIKMSHIIHLKLKQNNPFIIESYCIHHVNCTISRELCRTFDHEYKRGRSNMYEYCTTNANNNILPRIIIVLSWLRTPWPVNCDVEFSLFCTGKTVHRQNMVFPEQKIDLYT